MNFDRKLARIERITDLRPIEGADSIEVATILGWNVVVRKGDFIIDDLCVYVEIDSILPMSNDHFKFLDRGKGRPTFRVKTIKLRGQISQGIAFKTNILPREAVDRVFSSLYDTVEGFDVSEDLGVTLYEPNPYSPRQGMRARGNFPIFIPKTGCSRLQNTNNSTWSMLQGEDVYVTEKLDGTSVTFYQLTEGGYYGKNHFGVCSRNLDLEDEEGNLYWSMAHNLGIKEILSRYDCDIAVQGEIIGPAIQGNKYGLGGQQFYVFSVYLIEKGKYLTHIDLLDFCANTGLKMVPVLDVSNVGDKTQRDFADAYAKMSVLNDKVLAEGYVIRTTGQKHNDLLIKYINPEFLLKHGE